MSIVEADPNASDITTASYNDVIPQVEEGGQLTFTSIFDSIETSVARQDLEDDQYSNSCSCSRPYICETHAVTHSATKEVTKFSKVIDEALVTDDKEKRNILLENAGLLITQAILSRALATAYRVGTDELRTDGVTVSIDGDEAQIHGTEELIVQLENLYDKSSIEQVRVLKGAFNLFEVETEATTAAFSRIVLNPMMGIEDIADTTVSSTSRMLGKS
jgi:hypothetical protein